MAERLFGRDAELEVIGSALASARAGRGALVVIEGPAGCGKTALLRAALSRTEGCLACRAAGGEFERTAAFGVARELLAGAVGDRMATSGAAALAAPLFRAQTAGAPADEATLRHGLYRLVADLAGDRALSFSSTTCIGPTSNQHAPCSSTSSTSGSNRPSAPSSVWPDEIWFVWPSLTRDKRQG